MRLLPRRPLAVLVSSAALLLAAPPLLAQEFTPGRLFVASSGSDGVIVFNDKGVLAGGLQAGAALTAPRALVFGPDGRVYVTAHDTGTVAVFTGAGANVANFTVGSPGSDPAALGFGADGHLLVVDATTSKLFAFNVAGATLGSVDLPAGDYSQCGLAFGPDGHLFLSDLDSASVLELDAGGALVRSIGAGHLAAPAGLAFGPGGQLFVADGDSVIIFDDAGSVAGTFNGAALTDGRAIAFGPDGHIFVGDDTSGDIVEFTSGGAQLKAFGSSDGLSHPGVIAFAPWRFKASIKGSLARPGLPLQNVKETNAVLALQPGACTLMLALTDDVSNTADLASVFSSGFLVFHGFEGRQDDAATLRLFHGAQAAAPAQQDGVASVVMQVKGSLKNGAFTPKKAVGGIQRAGAAGVYMASLKTSSLVK